MRLFAHLKKPHKVSNKKKKYLTYCICLYIENENDLKMWGGVFLSKYIPLLYSNLHLRIGFQHLTDNIRVTHQALC